MREQENGLVRDKYVGRDGQADRKIESEGGREWAS